MKNGVLYCLMLAIASIVGYTVATRAMEDSRDFR